MAVKIDKKIKGYAVVTPEDKAKAVHADPVPRAVVEADLQAPDRHIADVIQMIFFGCVMLGAAFFMFRGRPESGGEVEAKPFWILLLIGALVGLLIGFVGVGGGFMYVPALIFLVGMGTKRAVGTSLMIIALNAAVAFTRYLVDGDVRAGFMTTLIGDIPLWIALVVFTLLTFAGVFAGTALAKRTEPGRLRRWFALLLILMAIYVLAEEISRL